MSNDSAYVEDWRSMLGKIYEEIGIRLSRRTVWRGLNEMLAANPAIDHIPYAFGTYTEGYATSQAMAIRRQTKDSGKDNPTLRRVLDHLQRRHREITRRWYVSRAEAASASAGVVGPDDPEAQELAKQAFKTIATQNANNEFDRFAAPDGKCLADTWCRDAIQRIEHAAHRVNDYVDVRIAHTSTAEVVIPLFNGLDDALDTCASVVKDLKLLIDGAAADVELHLVFDWTEGLEVPWQHHE
jgi:hypothetical protein